MKDLKYELTLNAIRFNKLTVCADKPSLNSFYKYKYKIKQLISTLYLIKNNFLFYLMKYFILKFA